MPPHIVPIYRVREKETFRTLGEAFGQSDPLLIGAELAAANPDRADVIDGLPTLLGGLQENETLKVPPSWIQARQAAWMLGAEPQTLGAAHPGESAPGIQDTEPTQYVPEDWDLVAGTYTVPDNPGTTYTAGQLAYLAGVERADLPNYAHEITTSDGWNGYANDPKWWHDGAVIKMPPRAITNIIALGCPSGYQRAADGKNCEKIPDAQPPAPPPKTPALAGKDTATMWLVVAGVLAALGIVVAVKKSKKKKAA